MSKTTARPKARTLDAIPTPFTTADAKLLAAYPVWVAAWNAWAAKRNPTDEIWCAKHGVPFTKEAMREYDKLGTIERRAYARLLGIPARSPIALAFKARVALDNVRVKPPAATPEAMLAAPLDEDRGDEGEKGLAVLYRDALALATAKPEGDDAAFVTLFANWQASDKEAQRARDAVERAIAKARRSLPKLPPIALALGFRDHDGDQLLAAVKERLAEIDARAKECAAERECMAAAIAKSDAPVRRACEAIVTFLENRAEAEAAIEDRPAIKALIETRDKAVKREAALLDKVIGTPANTPAGIAAKLREFGLMHLEADDPEEFSDEAAGGSHDVRFALSALRDVIRLAGEGRP